MPTNGSRADRATGTITPRPWTANPNLRDEPVPMGRPRRYDVTWIDAEGRLDSFARVAPAAPLFEEAFSAFARGTLIQTVGGPVAIEDLLPGTEVITKRGSDTLAWIGAMTLIPDATGTEPMRLFRVTADAFGLDRPMPDLMLGPSARIVSRAPNMRAGGDGMVALAPARAFVDGFSVIEVSPASAVRVFHLGFHGHRIIRANGVEVESFHPGSLNIGRLGRNALDLFLSLFPHVEDLSGFGRLAMPRLADDELEQVRAA